MVADVIVSDAHGAGADKELATLRHRISRVYCEIHDHLFQHPGISFDLGIILSITTLKSDVFTEQPGQHIRQVLKDGVQVQHFSLNKLLAAKQSRRIATVLAGKMDSSSGRSSDRAIA